MAACQDATGPEEIATATLNPEMRLTKEGVDELKALGDNLDDITGWSLLALGDSPAKGQIVGLLNGMKGHLASGKLAVCQQDVTDARAWFNSLTEVQQTEVGAVGIALDVIQAGLDKAAQ